MMIWICIFKFLQPVNIACYAEGCNSYSRDGCMYVCLSAARWYCV